MRRAELMGWMRRAGPLAALWLTACSVVDFGRPGVTGSEEAYVAAFPYYAEFCALSQIKKRPGFGVEVRGEIGGHAVLYLNGACRGDGPDRQVLQLCGGGAPSAESGVGLSMREHFRNTRWVAVPGRAFLFDGTLRHGEGLTRDRYLETRAEARRLGLYDGVEFHPRAAGAMPAGMPREDYEYEVSIATDYAVSFGRGRYCARVPVTRAQMGAMVDFLNAENAPYRSGREEFRWSLFRDNCTHLAHNALAAAAVWEEWPTNRPLPIALFDFPVPKNEFVNLMRRTNDPDLLDPAAAYRDPAARRSVLRFGQLPVRPGAIAQSWPPRQPNEVYETALKLAFYDEPHFGPYRGWLRAILADPRQFDLQSNLRHFAARYRQLRASPQTNSWLAARDMSRDASPDASIAAFHARFYAALDWEIGAVEAYLAGPRGTRQRTAVSGLPQ